MDAKYHFIHQMLKPPAYAFGFAQEEPSPAVTKDPPMSGARQGGAEPVPPTGSWHQKAGDVAPAEDANTPAGGEPAAPAPAGTNAASAAVYTRIEVLEAVVKSLMKQNASLTARVAKLEERRCPSMEP